MFDNSRGHTHNFLVNLTFRCIHEYLFEKYNEALLDEKLEMWFSGT